MDRKFEKLNEGKKWECIEFEQIKAGDTIRTRYHDEDQFRYFNVVGWNESKDQIIAERRTVVITGENLTKTK
jgi:hypothetical protein